MAWRHLPEDARVRVLMFLPLPVLRALKALDRGTATLCRRVLRSAEWQARAPLNWFMLTEEVNDSLGQIRFPLKVSILDQRFEMPPECGPRLPHLLATIHRIDVLCWDCDKCTSVTPTFSDADGDKIHRIVDLCIEINGTCIVSSESGLRVLLDDSIRRDGVRLCPVRQTDKFPTCVNAWREAPNGLSLSATPEVTALDLLDSMTLRTNVAQDTWVWNEGPPGRGGGLGATPWAMTLLDLMKRRMGPFRRPPLARWSGPL